MHRAPELNLQLLRSISSRPMHSRPLVRPLHARPLYDAHAMDRLLLHHRLQPRDTTDCTIPHCIIASPAFLVPPRPLLRNRLHFRRPAPPLRFFYFLDPCSAFSGGCRVAALLNDFLPPLAIGERGSVRPIRDRDWEDGRRTGTRGTGTCLCGWTRKGRTRRGP